MSRRAKILLALLTLTGVAVYLVVVDYGVNAGRIHRGVSVHDVDLGGRTKEEAFAILSRYGADLESAPVILTREGVSCNFIPTELGWQARPFETAIAAYRVGRGEALPAAMATRVKAWFEGVTVDWTGGPNPAAVSRLLDRCERDAAAVGHDVRRYRLRKKIRRAIVTWPRRPFNIPIRS